VLISDGEPRTERRVFVEKVLEPGRPLHDLAAPWAQVIQEEARRALAAAEVTGQLDWDTFNEAWWKVVRRVVFGSDGPAEREITDLLARLRMDGNWAYLHPQRKRLRARFDELLRRRLAAASPDSLAAKIATTPAGPNVDPAGQVPHWLFAFDAAGIATYRALPVGDPPRTGRPGARGGRGRRLG
jgi:hypothetical protein